jgi:hypothetical protein
MDSELPRLVIPTTEVCIAEPTRTSPKVEQLEPRRAN